MTIAFYNIPEKNKKKKYVSYSVQSRANLLCKGTRVCHDFIKWIQGNDIVNNMETLHFPDADLNCYIKGYNLTLFFEHRFCLD